MQYLTNLTCLIIYAFDLIYHNILETIIIAALIKIIQIAIKKKFGSLNPKIVLGILIAIPIVIFILNKFDYLICQAPATKKKQVQIDPKSGLKYVATKGVFINETDIITSSEINLSCKSIRVLKQKQDENIVFDSQIIKILDQSKGNLTFLRSKTKNKHFAIIANNNLAQGQELFYLRKNNDKIIVKKTSVAKFDPGIYRAEFFSKDSGPGNSGAPLYNQKGYIVGILWGGNQEQENKSGYLTYATSLAKIKDFAKKHNIKLYSIAKNSHNLILDQNYYQNFGAKIICDNFANNIFGTGVFINKNTVMTNHHVIKNCKKIEVLANKQKYQSQVIAKLSDANGDIAFLQTDKISNYFALMSYYSAESNPLVFFPDFVTPNPRSSRFKIGRGTMKYMGQKHSILILNSRDLSIADSGLPIFDKKGFLVAINQGQIVGFGKDATPANVMVSAALLNSIPIYSYDATDFNTKLNPEQIKDAMVDIFCFK